MSTHLKQHAGPLFLPPTRMPRTRTAKDANHLRHDRWIALLVVVVLIAMMALITWLASLGGSVDPGTFNNWDLMM